MTFWYFREFHKNSQWDYLRFKILQLLTIGTSLEILVSNEPTGKKEINKTKNVVARYNKIQVKQNKFKKEKNLTQFRSYK